MISLSRATLIGNLGKDPESRFTPGGTQVTTFSIATAESWKDKSSGEWQKRTDWHSCVAWGKTAEIAGNLLKKGKQCYVEGKLTTRSWDGKDGTKHYKTEIVVDKMILLGSKESRGESRHAGDDGDPGPAESGNYPKVGPDGSIDDLPF